MRTKTKYIFCWPKINRLPDISPAKIYLGSAENCSSGSATMVSHVQVLHTAREPEHCYRVGKEVGKVRVNNESVAFHWLSHCWERRGVRLLPVGLCYCCGAWGFPPLASWIYVVEVSVYYYYYFFFLQFLIINHDITNTIWVGWTLPVCRFYLWFPRVGLVTQGASLWAFVWFCLL